MRDVNPDPGKLRWRRLADAGDLGGKARGLHRLEEAGLPIPETRVVPATTLELLLDGATPTASLIRGLRIPVAVESAWIAAARTLGARLAVRSSGVDEDGRDQSFAGVHETVLDVAPEDVVDAIRRVWASGFSERALAYRSSGQPRMAVVLQPMLEPLCAGVVFTINPQNGSWREAVVEAVWGQGEALVSGRTAPQYWVVRRPRDLPGRRLWNRLSVRVVQHEAVPQDGRWSIGSNHQLVRTALGPHERDLPVLSESDALGLVRLALRAEHRLGEPLDLEWARVDGRFVLLQARPITRTGSPRKREILWTRRFFGERWPHPPTPISWSLLAPIIDSFIAYPDVQARYLGGGPATRLIRGRPYLNATVFRHLLFKWPGAPAPEFMLELIPPDEVDEWRRRFRVSADWTVYNAIFATTWRERRWRRFAFNPVTNHRVWADYASRFEAEQRRLSTPVLGRADAIQRVRAQQELVREYLSIHVCSLLFANLWYQVLEGCLASWAPGSTSAWMERLAVCPPGNRTLETNEALWTLAHQLGVDGREALSGGRALDPVDAQALQDFIDDYGHRAEASWEVFSPRWGDDPSRLVALMSTTGRRPRVRVGEQEARFAEARRDVLAAVPGWRGLVLDGMIELTRRYLLLRENQRFAFDRLLAGMRSTLVTLGEQLGLDDPTEIRWLTWDEVCGLADGSFTGPLPIASRRAAHVVAVADDPPIFFRGDESADGGLDGRRLTGLGVSSGRCRGRVRILRSPADGAKLEEGEVLVAHAVDPGWTPLLLRAGAVVLELGSLLSHGAVVAREYDVPAVVNLSGVTRHLSDGMEVTVDGTRGLVWIHGSEKDGASL